MPEHLDGDATRKRMRVSVGIAVAAVAVAVAVAWIATSGHGGSPPRLPHSPSSLLQAPVHAPTNADAVDALLAGIPQHASVLGDQTAPVTLQWFGDLQCPFCKEFALGALPAIISRWVRGGQVRLVYRSMQSATRQPAVFETQQVAALAAGGQQRMWNFIETFSVEQGAEDSNYVTERYLQGIASQIPGLNLAQWMSDRASPEIAAEMAADRAAVEAAGLRATPAFLIGRTRGRRVYELGNVSLTNPTQLNNAIEKILKVSRSPGAHGARDLSRSPIPPRAAAA